MTEIPEIYLDILQEKRAFAHLATVMPDGSPQNTPVWFDFTVAYPHARDAARHLLTRLKQHHPAIFQADKAATPHVGKPLQRGRSHPRRRTPC